MPAPSRSTAGPAPAARLAPKEHAEASHHQGGPDTAAADPSAPAVVADATPPAQPTDAGAIPAPPPDHPPFQVGAQDTPPPQAAPAIAPAASVSVASAQATDARPASPATEATPAHTAPNADATPPGFAAAMAAHAPQGAAPDTQAAAAPAAAALHHAADAAADQVSVRIARAVQDGIHTMTVELHPGDLGRVEVKLSFGESGVGVQMTMDRQETFDAFQRNRASMEQQLSQAGIDLGTGGLDFRFGQQPGFVPQPSMPGYRMAMPVAALPVSSILAASPLRDGRINILA